MMQIDAVNRKYVVGGDRFRETDAGREEQVSGTQSEPRDAVKLWES